MEKVIEKDSKQYALATEMAMFMARNLRNVGIDVVVTTDEHARKALENEKGDVEFSMRDIMNLSYTWNGEEVSMRGFAEQFMSEIKQKDRTMEDAERIAKTFIEAVKADPEKAGMKMLKAEKMANAFRFKLPDGTVYSPEHPMAMSPEYQKQKRLWEIYEHVLGKETMREFIGLLSKNAPMSSEERRRYSELESRVNGSDYMQSRLEVPASKVNENRVKDIRNLIQYFEGNDDYTWTEKALIVKGAMSFGYSEKKEADSTRVETKNISDNNSVSVPVIGGEAAAVVEGLRKGLNFEDALVQARIMLSKESKRSVGGNFTGWKVYKQSDKEEDAVILNQDVAGTGWCTGGAVSTARSHLSGGDFHVYYEAGEPLIAIRTQDGLMAEPPRGAHKDQSCKPREEQIAFDYIRSGNGIIAGNAYIADIEDIRRVMSPNATPLDAFMMPDERRYENGEFGDDTKAWGKSVEQRIAELVPDKKEERWKLGLYYGYEIEDACKNGNAIAIKGSVRNGDAIVIEAPVSLTLPKGATKVGDIELYGSASLTLSEGVTQVGLIYLHHSASLTLPEGVTHVEGIYLYDSASLTLPEGVKHVGDIELYDSASLTLPEGVTQVGNIDLCDSTSLTLPEGVTRVGNIYLYDSASLTLPAGLTQVGHIKLFGSTSLTFPEGVTQVGNIELYGSASLTLPDGVTQVGYIEIYGSASLTLPESVTQVVDIHLRDSSSLALPEGLMQVGNIHLRDSSSLALPEGLMQVGNIKLRDSSSLTLPEGVTQVGNINLCDSTSLTLPEGVTRVGNIYLYDSASLTLPEGVTQVGYIELSGSASLTLPDGVTQVGDIELRDSTSLTLPEGVTRVGNIYLYDSASLTLPAGLTQVGEIRLIDSASLALPEGVTQVGGIRLGSSASFTLPDGVTQVGNIELYDSSSLTLPEGVKQVGNIELSGSASLTLPDGVTQVGNIELRGSSSLTLPEGVTQVGSIELHGNTSLTLPEGVTQVGSIYLFGSSSLTLSEGVTQVGNIALHNSDSLTLPEGLTQVGNIHLSPGSSITFPDGFVLRKDMGGRMHYTSEKINEILSEHQKKTEFRLADGTIYGYQQGDTIYLTPAGINPNTPIHEYAHLWAKVYEKIQPDQWEAMKVELKGLPLWEEIASSRDYQHLSGDENRLAGEVLATVVGNKGEELLLEHAGQLINETGNPVAIKDAVQSFRDRLTRIAVEDVFKVEGMEHVGAVTLKVLKDFAEGKGIQLVQEQEQNLSKMVKYVPERSINNERQGKSSTLRTSLPDENVPRFVKSGANVRTFDEVSKDINSLSEQIGLANNNLDTRVEFSTSYNNKHSQYDKDKLNMITNTKINTECGYTVAKVSDHIHNFPDIKQQLKKTPSVLIYNNNELFYSGPMAEEFKHQFARDIKVGLAYYGQDPADGMGYFGYKEGALPKEEINAVLANLENKIIVKHELLEEKNRKENASVENTRKISEGEAAAPARELTREERRQKLQEKARENNQKMLDRIFSGKSTNKKSTEVKQKK